MPSKPSFGIRGQILTIAAAPALIVTAILIFVIYRGNILEGDLALDRQGALLAAQLAANLEYALATGALEQIPSTVSSSVDPAIETLEIPTRRVTVRDRTNQTVFSTPAGSPSAVTEEHSLPWLIAPDDVKSFAAPIYLKPLDADLFDDATTERRYLGDVIVEVSTAPIKINQFKNLLGDLGLVIITFGGALVLAYWIGRRLSGAIREAAEAILRIKGGDLGVRLRKTESTEIGTLQEGVNLAVEAIVQGKEALETALAKVRAEHEVALSQLRIQTEAAQRANQAKSMFLAKVSHEMRTPLYAIQGLTEQLLESPRDAEDTACLRNMLNASNSLYQTIGDVLDFTQLESGKHQPTFRAFDFWDEIETTTETIGLLAQGQRLYLDVIVAKEVPSTALGDPKGFRAIVANLLTNAVKFTTQGGICVRLALQSRSANQAVMIQLQVEDTGRGIPPDRLDTIFEPFEQIEGGLNRRFGGSGLGLSIVKQYCGLMGGSVEVASELGTGSTFTVRLPFQIPEASTDGSHAARFAEFRVLVVDERPSFCESVQSRWSSLGMGVVSQRCALESLAALAPPLSRFDLVVVRDLSRTEALAEMMRFLRAWAEHTVSLETTSDNERPQMLLNRGVSAVLWSGASRHAIAGELRRIRGDKLAEIPSNLETGTNHDPVSARSDLEGKRVLVVEDFEINREIMSRQLKNHGLHVIEASDGGEAVTLALQRDVDLILMDIQMPGTDGISAIKAIRRQTQGQGVPIVGFTASADKLTHRRVLAAGADHVLTKPIGEADLIASVRDVISRES